MVRITPIDKPFRRFGRGTTLLRGLTNHGCQPLTNWDDPPSSNHGDHKSPKNRVGLFPFPNGRLLHGL